MRYLALKAVLQFGSSHTKLAVRHYSNWEQDGHTLSGECGLWILIRVLSGAAALAPRWVLSPHMSMQVNKQMHGTRINGARSNVNDGHDARGDGGGKRPATTVVPKKDFTGRAFWRFATENWVWVRYIGERRLLAGRQLVVSCLLNLNGRLYYLVTGKDALFEKKSECASTLLEKHRKEKEKEKKERTRSSFQ